MTVSRLQALRSHLAERRLDGIMITKPENRAYLSGFTGSAGTLLISEEHACLVTDFRYVEQATSQAPDFQILKPDATIGALVAKLCDDYHVKRLGFEGDFLTVDEYHLTEQLHAGRELISVSGLVEGLRMIKDETEVELMAKAAAIADAAWAETLPLIKPGTAERDVAVELEYKMKKHGADGLAFDIICASGVRSSLPHGRASDKLIEAGDLVTCDFGALYKGYCSDMTRTVMVGEPAPKQREIYAIVLEAQRRGVAGCRAGITGADLDAICRDYIREQGYAEMFGHGTGHGVGRFIHEGPRVSARGAEDVLLAGMVVTVEPGIYLPGWGGVRIEDTVLVQAGGCERLTKSPKELIIL
ncbi:MAG TPA: Xaa-Pro peptidase family protein [Symbiobacteriaceae bacterium]|jgi:Xaa-Pro aminopeptidase